MDRILFSSGFEVLCAWLWLQGQNSSQHPLNHERNMYIYKYSLCDFPALTNELGSTNVPPAFCFFVETTLHQAHKNRYKYIGLSGTYRILSLHYSLVVELQLPATIYFMCPTTATDSLPKLSSPLCIYIPRIRRSTVYTCLHCV